MARADGRGRSTNTAPLYFASFLALVNDIAVVVLSCNGHVQVSFSVLRARNRSSLRSIEYIQHCSTTIFAGSTVVNVDTSRRVIVFTLRRKDIRRGPFESTFCSRNVGDWAVNVNAGITEVIFVISRGAFVFQCNLIEIIN